MNVAKYRDQVMKSVNQRKRLRRKRAHDLTTTFVQRRLCTQQASSHKQHGTLEYNTQDPDTTNHKQHLDT
ncbi:hypothetical protein EMCRGX_G028885 [Ephydatia muelleri]